MNEVSTPRYGHAPISMKRVASTHDVLSVGEFAWENESDGRYIMVALPRFPYTPNRYVINYLPVTRGGNDHGKHWGWDGNEDTPTLTLSIHCIGHWHGWVRNGMLVEA